MRLRSRRPWLVATLVLLLVFATGFAVVRTNVLGMGDRFERLTARIENFIDPPPDRSTIPTVVVTPDPSAVADGRRRGHRIGPTPAPTPLAREPVDLAVVDDHEAVFTSQITEKDCAVAGTQMVLTILGLGNASNEFQTEIHDRIGEWESLDDSLNGGWGPAAVALALAAYGEPGYEIRAYESYDDALRDSAIAITEMDKPVVMFPWWGAHTWVMTGFRADADPVALRRCRDHRRLHPRPVVSARLLDLGAVRPARQLRGPRGARAQLAGLRGPARATSRSARDGRGPRAPTLTAMAASSCSSRPPRARTPRSGHTRRAPRRRSQARSLTASASASRTTFAACPIAKPSGMARIPTDRQEERAWRRP